MEAWTSEILNIIRMMAGNVKHTPEMVVALGAAGLVSVIVLEKAAKAFHASMSETPRAAAVVVIGLVVTILAITAVNLYVVPDIDNNLARTILPVATAIIVVLAIVAPLCCLILKSGYLQGLLSALISILAAVIIVFLVKGASGAIRHGEKGFKKTKNRTEEVNKIL